MANTMLSFTLPQRRILNTIYRWGYTVGMVGRTLMEAADAEVSDLSNLEEADLITAHDVGGNQFPIKGTPDFRILRHRVRLTAAGKSWVERPANMLLREIVSSPKGHVTLRRAMEITNDTRLIRQCVEDGYATLHAVDHNKELPNFSRQGIEFQMPEYYFLRPTSKTRKVVGS